MKIIRILSFVLLTCLFTLKANAFKVKFRDTTVTVGQTLYYPVYVDTTLSGQNIISFQLSVYFNPATLEFLGVSSTGSLSQTWGSPTTNMVNDPSYGNLLKIAHAGSTPLSGQGVLCYILFKPKQATGNTISLYPAQYNYFNEGQPAFITQAGNVSATAIPSITVYPNTATVCITDSLLLSTSGGTAPYTYSLTNPGLATISNNGYLKPIQGGLTKIISTDASGLKDTSDQWIELKGIKLSIRDTSAWQGSFVDIPVYSSSLTGLTITSGTLNIDYYINYLTFQSVETAGTLTSAYGTITANESVPGTLKIAFAGTTPLSGSGILFNLRFKVSSQNQGATYITPSNIVFNQDIYGCGKYGYFSTKNYQTLTITPNNGELVVGNSLQLTGGNGILPYSWEVSNTQLASISGTGLLTALHGGQVTVTLKDAVGAQNTSSVFTIYDNTLDLPDTTACLNSTILYPVYYSQLPTPDSLSSIQGLLNFNPNELAFEGIETTNSLAAGWSSNYSLPTPSSVQFALAGSSGVTQNGNLFYFKFRLLNPLTANLYSYLSISSVVQNQGHPISKLSNGFIKGIDAGISKAAIPSGNTIMCKNITQSSYSTAALTNVSGYEWNLLPTAAGTITGNSTSCQINWNLNYTGIAKLTVRGSSGCSSGSSSDTLYIKREDYQQVNGGPDKTVCLGSSVNLTATGGSSYSWNNGATVATISVSPLTSTTFTVTATNSCGSSSDLVNVTLINIPMVNAGSDKVICTGTSLVLQASGADNYSWNTGETTSQITVTPAAATAYTVTGLNSCGSSTDIVNVSIGNAIHVNAGNDVTICKGNSATLTATGASSYIWSNGSTNSSINVSPTQTTTYSVTGNSVCGSGADLVTVIVNTTPVANAGNDQYLCSGNSTYLSGSGGDTYSWSTGNNTQQTIVSPTITSTYTLYVYNSCGVSLDEVKVVVGNYPSANAGSDISICKGESAQLTATGGSSYSWNNGTTGSANIVSPATTTTYSVTVTNSCGTASDIVKVWVNEKPGKQLQNQTICAGTTALLTAGNADQYLWSTGETTSGILVTPTATTLYTVTLGNSCGSTIDSAIIQVGNNANINAGNDIAICQGLATQLNAIGGTQYLWNTGDTTPSVIVSPLTTTYYVVNGSNNCGLGTDTVWVIVNRTPTVNAGADVEICLGSSVLLTATYNEGSVLWNTGVGQAQQLVSPATQTSYWAQATNQCGSTTDSVTVYIGTTPYVNAGPDVESCIGNTIVLTASGSESYSWSNGDTTSSVLIPVFNDSVLIVTGYSSCGSAVDTVTLTITSLPAINLGNDTIITAGSTVLLAVTLPIGTNVVWSTGETSNTIQASTGTYWVMISNDCGFVTDTIQISEIPNGLLNGYSNGFTVFPNPTSNQLTLQSAFRIVELNVVDITGKVVMRLLNPPSTISLKELPEGLYHLSAVNEKQELVHQVIHKHTY